MRGPGPAAAWAPPQQAGFLPHGGLSAAAPAMRHAAMHQGFGNSMRQVPIAPPVQQPVYRQMSGGMPSNLGASAANASSGGAAPQPPSEIGFSRRRGEGKSYGGGPSSINLGSGLAEETSSPRGRGGVKDRMSPSQVSAPSIIGSPTVTRNQAAPSLSPPLASARNSNDGGRLGANVAGARSSTAASNNFGEQISQMPFRDSKAQRRSQTSSSVPPPSNQSGQHAMLPNGSEDLSESPAHGRSHWRSASPDAEGGQRRRGEGRSSGGGPTSISLFGGCPAANGSLAATAIKSLPTSDLDRDQQMPRRMTATSPVATANRCGLQAAHTDGEAIRATGPNASFNSMATFADSTQRHRRPSDEASAHLAANRRLSYDELETENERLRTELAQVHSELAVYRRWYDGMVGAG